MKRLAILAGAAALAVPAAAAAPTSTTHPGQATSDPCSAHPRPAAEQRKLATTAFALRRWRAPKPSDHAVGQMRQLRRCAPRSALPAMRRSWRAAKRELARYVTYRQVAPYRGPGGSGPRSPHDGRWWAIPYYIPACESGGGGPPDFHVGFAGAYGILVATWHQYGDGHWYEAGDAPALPQHQAARRIWLAVGPSAWECA